MKTKRKKRVSIRALLTKSQRRITSLNERLKTAKSHEAGILRKRIRSEQRYLTELSQIERDFAENVKSMATIKAHEMLRRFKRRDEGEKQ